MIFQIKGRVKVIILSTDIDSSYILKKIKSSFLNVIHGKVPLHEANIIAHLGSEPKSLDTMHLNSDKA